VNGIGCRAKFTLYELIYTHHRAAGPESTNNAPFEAKYYFLSTSQYYLIKTRFVSLKPALSMYLQRYVPVRSSCTKNIHIYFF
jgi:hypothetical protein